VEPHGQADSQGPDAARDEEAVRGDADATLDSIIAEFAALSDHATDYATAKVDALRARFRGLLAGLVIRLCAIGLFVITVGSLWLSTLRGVSGGLEAATGRAWLADLLTGVFGLAAAWAVTVLYRRGIAHQARNRVVRKHERRKTSHRRRDRHAPDGPFRRAA